MSLISTNTISQGDTRETGLTQICNHGGEIFECIKRKRWPGAAAVIVSVVWLCKGKYKYQKELDGKKVDKITSYLVDKGGNDSPLPLKVNAHQSFQGSVLLGMGFTFEELTPEEEITSESNSIRVMNELIESDPKNKERIFPYLGGDELNSNCRGLPERYTVDLMVYH